MIYVIMCGGYYDVWKEPKQLAIVNGERIIDRTIRLLRENDVGSIAISSNDPRFEDLGVPVLHHLNEYRSENGQLTGYWLDAFYPHFDKTDEVTFIFGDVYFSEDAMRQIVNCQRPGNTLFGSKIAENPWHKNWGEPFAYVVKDYETFMRGVQTVKDMFDAGALARHPIVWELYRFLNGLDINIQQVRPGTFVAIDDETIDLDSPTRVADLEKKLKEMGR